MCIFEIELLMQQSELWCSHAKVALFLVKYNLLSPYCQVTLQSLFVEFPNRLKLRSVGTK